MSLVPVALQERTAPPPATRQVERFSVLRGSVGGWATATCTAMMLGGLLPLLLTPVGMSDLSRLPVLLTFVVLLYSAVRLSCLLISGRERLIDATFWIFVYVLFGLAALSQVVSQRFALPSRTTYPESAQVRGVAVIIVGLVAYELGRLFARFRPRASHDRKTTEFALLPRRIWIVGGVALIATAYFVATQGIALQFSSRQTVTEALLGTAPRGMRLDQLQDKARGLAMLSVRWLPTFVALYLLIHLRRSVRSGGTRRTKWVDTTAATGFLALLVIANILMNNPFANPRYRFGGIALAIGLAVAPLVKPHRFRIAVLAVVAGFLLLFPLADAFRYETYSFSAAPLREELIASPDFSMFQQHFNAQIYVGEHGHTLGRQVLGSVLGFYPRRWWPDKPISTGDIISRTQAINASADLWVEAYVDGGFPAVASVFFLYGWVALRFEQAYMRRKMASLSAVGVLVPLFAAFQLFVLRGSLQPVVGELAPLAIIVLLCTRRTRAPARSVA